MSEDNLSRWKTALLPLYGERETNNMWRWYQEAYRPEASFEDDLQKLSESYPIQYLTGYSYFYGEKFLVNEHTLIPRPETEELVYKILEEHPEKDELRVIDLGTGTGCIAITIKKHRPGWFVTGMDIFDKTLAMARENGHILGAEVSWVQGDILSLEISDISSYDIVVSNPPYISPLEKEEMDSNVVQYEPHHALFTRDDHGLEFYKAIAGLGKFLKPGSKIYLEIHEGASKEIAALFSHPKTYTSPEIHTDMQGKDRILSVTRR